MRFGVCCGIDNEERVKIAVECGYDYIECGFQMFANATEEQLAEWEGREKKYGILCESTNCFLPNSHKVTGENVDYDALKEFVARGMKNSARMGVKTVVFGSSGARNIPDGFSYAKGFSQMGYFLREIAAPEAEKYGITIVTEPLQKAESNMINTVKEGVMLAVLADKNNVRGLADLFHMEQCGDTSEDIRLLNGLIHHAHISNPVGRDGRKRIYPSSVDEFDYKAFIDALKEGGCERCSVEADVIDFSIDAPQAIKVLRSL
ncbi:MAG: sugar phosphate isomerase/epimerase [Ruminococcaceae bacterium]|nr:sugar phosphate isomerase/epimerase [Oscillospiraceae bacterium]MBR3595775.1 sugar phosphate isomerase/epimerase [Clostridia bacterium]